MRKIISKEKYYGLSVNEQEWLEIKNHTIGGSEAAAVLNKSKWLTSNDLYNKLALGKVKTFKKNDRMIEGQETEKFIRGLFAHDFKDQFELIKLPTKNRCIFIRKDKPYLSCTPDSLALNKSSGKLWGIEFKNVELRTREEKAIWESKDLPDQYYWQDNQYLVVLTDLEGVLLFAHLKYFSFNEEKQKWEFDHAEDRAFWMYRKEVSDHVVYLEKKETDLVEINVKGRIRPKTSIQLKHI